MYLQKEELLQLSQDNQLIDAYEKHNFHNISYDLRLDSIQWVDHSPQVSVSHVLKPGDSVFVSTMETIQVPNDMMGIIIPRNSSIRMGLDIAAPVYQPGHHTRVFVRVTNIADNEITISQGISLFSIMFYRLEKDVTDPYEGIYTDQFDFADVKGVHSVQTAIAKVAQSEKSEIASMVRNIYATVLTLMSIFIAMFSIMIINGRLLPEIHNGYGVIFINLVLIGTVAAFVGMVSVLFDTISHKIRNSLFGIFVMCFIGAMFFVHFM
ncbi:hypothetical protein AB840_06500 [Megasphaera cerevisiae DSM 20462]|jgi:deoxycytidine triphosphate deaminase|uniref:Uncharacterized protein n=1 Tax=Megasphaera cerevisiae DSM 20462 TaxID=1122219 RepID=A0A0J6WWZ4_9FIRM|nr:hypothetical protein [Megasphaera cerevisiae]KMO86753.1 hypothetical protein AB840_06500 [Megasphaera cerevisiae DSM 20462]MCI1751219.1 hypothetical protein [Megasphaera cerevisiae]OKY53717.1 hypothetical protein BSR42_06115 [Megasphaera cerevisiae]SJZ92828.1 deoxycytidine triphosphate deaminase [Megasphaera cerevisiae DSM 20462]